MIYYVVKLKKQKQINRRTLQFKNKLNQRRERFRQKRFIKESQTKPSLHQKEGFLIVLYRLGSLLVTLKLYLSEFRVKEEPNLSE